MTDLHPSEQCIVGSGAGAPRMMCSNPGEHWSRALRVVYGQLPSGEHWSTWVVPAQLLGQLSVTITVGADPCNVTFPDTLKTPPPLSAVLCRTWQSWSSVTSPVATKSPPPSAGVVLSSMAQCSSDSKEPSV